VAVGREQGLAERRAAGGEAALQQLAASAVSESVSCHGSTSTAKKVSRRASKACTKARLNCDGAPPSSAAAAR